jgi:hypothetical protein
VTFAGLAAEAAFLAGDLLGTMRRRRKRIASFDGGGRDWKGSNDLAELIGLESTTS